MKTLSIKPHSPHIELPTLHRVGADQPFTWLRKGWDDLRVNWAGSLTLGAAFAALGYLLVNFALDRPPLVMALTVGFLFVATLPMLIDRHVDLVTAMMTSLWVVRENPLPMLVWALVIGVSTLVGQALWFVALAVVFPILGHATWHAYRDLVERE